MAGTCFLDLPAEIRNTIYELALKQTGTLRFTRSSNGRRRGRIVQDGYRRWTPAILTASRQIYAEAAPVLYGYCMFELPISYLTDFIHQIGNSARYLRNLYTSIAFHPLDDLKSCLGSLKATTGLKCLWIHINPSNKPDPSDMAAALFPWAKARCDHLMNSKRYEGARQEDQNEVKLRDALEGTDLPFSFHSAFKEEVLDKLVSKLME